MWIMWWTAGRITAGCCKKHIKAKSEISARSYAVTEMWRFSAFYGGESIRRISTGTFYEPWILGEADSKLGCLPLPLFGYFLGFFGEGTDDADVTVVDYNLLLRRS